jgi:hypothetical protein
MAARTWRGNTYRFTVTAATAAAGDTYTNNGQTFTVTDAITGGTVLYCFGTGAPTASGNLVRTSGAGTTPIVFSAVTAPNTNWGTTTNWLENAVPLVADDVTFNANSRDCIVNTSNRVCRSIDFTNYTNTITFTFNVNVAGNVTLGAGMIIAGTGALNITAVSTLTPNGKIWTGNFGVSPSGIGVQFTVTLAAAFTVEGTFSHNTGSGATVSFNGFTLTLKGNLQFSTSGIAGTSNIVIAPPIGTTKTANSGVQFFGPSLDFNGDGTFNMLGNFTFGGATLKRTTGTINHITGTFTIGSSSLAVSIDTSGMSFNQMAVGQNGNVITLLSDINCRGEFYVQTATFAGSFNVNVGIIRAASGGCSGGTIVIRSGTTHLGVTYSAGTWNDGITNYSSNIVIAGNPTIGSCGMNGGSLTYTSGTPNFNGIFTIQGTMTLNLSGMPAFNNLTISTTSGNNANITNNAPFTVNGIMTNTHSNAAQVINWLGSSGWSTGTLLNSFTGGTLSLTSGITYTVRSAINFTGGTFATRPLIRASLTNSTKAILTLNQGATQTMVYVNGTDIDSSQNDGQTIWTFGGVITRTVNWNIGSRPGTVAYVFVY